MKTLNFIQPDQPVPNFSVQLQEGKTDFNSFRENKWTVMFTHPEFFIPTNTHAIHSFLKMKKFLTNRQAKLIGLNPENARFTNHKFYRNPLGKNSKIIIADNRGIVRSIFFMTKMDYKMVINAMKEVQKGSHTETRNQFSFQKTDHKGFYPTNLFIQKNHDN